MKISKKKVATCTLKYNNNNNKNIEYNVRGIIESQFLSMLLHSKEIGINTTDRILATGGASKNKSILQIMSDVFGVPVFTHSQVFHFFYYFYCILFLNLLIVFKPNSASLGAAFRALHGYKCKDKFISFDEVVSNGSPFQKEVDPDMNAHAIYKSMLLRYKNLEQKIMKKN